LPFRRKLCVLARLAYVAAEKLFQRDLWRQDSMSELVKIDLPATTHHSAVIKEPTTGQYREHW
jgi:hypothetical protein